MKEEYKLYATCPLNTEELLLAEINNLGGTMGKIVPSGVSFNGDLEVVYKVSLLSRIAGKLFLELKEFELTDQKDIYNEAKAIEWDTHFNLEDTFATSAAVVKSRIKNSKYASLLVKDGIADYFTEKYGSRPNVDPKRPSVKVHLHVSKNSARLSLDLSGDSLHKRGYRKGNAQAALKENVAAALLYRAAWPEMAKENLNFVDPMCGSGTILIEAAFIATNTPAGYYRFYYGFQGWKSHNIDLWDEIFDDAESKIVEYSGVIRGFDIDSDAISQATENVREAGFSKLIHVEKSELSEFKVVESMTHKTGLICVNPPYGIRLGEVGELKKTYIELGELFLDLLPGWKLSVISGNEELSKVIPLKIDRKNVLFNGAIKCRVSHFSLDSDKVKTIAPLSSGGEAFKNRLIKRRKHLGKWARRQDISSYRVYDADLPDYNVAIDIYEDKWVTVAEYQAPKDIEDHIVAKRLNEILRVVPEVLDIEPERVFLKVRKRQKGVSQYSKSGNTKEFHIIKESGAMFYVNFKDYLDTGIFLDHRPIRKRINSESKDK
ncbi:MAG: 23S rRNA (guanine(2445)-N(2))/(guanine(2069)-N(7))-methyltransferase, partial [Spirochaetaceae bacterium 4572_7]